MKTNSSAPSATSKFLNLVKYPLLLAIALIGIYCCGQRINGLSSQSSSVESEPIGGQRIPNTETVFTFGSKDYQENENRCAANSIRAVHFATVKNNGVKINCGNAKNAKLANGSKTKVILFVCDALDDSSTNGEIQFIGDPIGGGNSIPRNIASHSPNASQQSKNICSLDKLNSAIQDQSDIGGHQSPPKNLFY